MGLGLTGKRALVSGSTAGFGLATARALAAEGAYVTVNGRTQERVDSAVDELRSILPHACARARFDHERHIFVLCYDGLAHRFWHEA